MPTISMKEADKDWAVSFACPTDAEGLYMVYGRQSCDTRKMEDGANIDLETQNLAVRKPWSSSITSSSLMT